MFASFPSCSKTSWGPGETFWHLSFKLTLLWLSVYFCPLAVLSMLLLCSQLLCLEGKTSLWQGEANAVMWSYETGRAVFPAWGELINLPHPLPPSLPLGVLEWARLPPPAQERVCNLCCQHSYTHVKSLLSGRSAGVIWDGWMDGWESCMLDVLSLGLSACLHLCSSLWFLSDSSSSQNRDQPSCNYMQCLAFDTSPGLESLAQLAGVKKRESTEMCMCCTPKKINPAGLMLMIKANQWCTEPRLGLH